MIRIVRIPSTAPANLIDRETTHRPNARALPGAPGPLQNLYVDGRVKGADGNALKIHQPQTLVDSDGIKGYGDIRPDLYRMQHRKCCYCESTPEEKHHHVEHFRPKSCYWWLSWSWPNLLFSCAHCNEAKLNYFPLFNSECLQPEDETPGAEESLLIDPSDPIAVDPLDHIEFKPVGHLRWRPFPRAGSRLGQELIAAAQLDRYPLRDQYKQHAGKFEDAVARIRCVVSTTTDTVAIQSIWNDVCERWLSAGYAYVALSRDILVHNFAGEIRDYALDISVRYPP